jgi:hypothetical protein
VSLPDLFRALAVVSEGTSPGHRRVAASLGLPGDLDVASHTDLFCFQLPPYAAIHLGAEGMLGGEPAERVAGFWRALGLVPPAEPDHLAALLGLYADLTEAEEREGDAARCRLLGEARRALLWEHLLPWAPMYAQAAVRTAADPTYRTWAETLELALLAEAERSPWSGGPMPLHLREAPEPALPSDGGIDSFLAGILAPARSGMVITRHDLARAARQLGLGLRIGERRYVLSALVAQEPAAMFAWLADEARRSAEQLAGPLSALDPVAAFWKARAQRSESCLRQVSEAQGGPMSAKTDAMLGSE